MSRRMSRYYYIFSLRLNLKKTAIISTNKIKKVINFNFPSKTKEESPTIIVNKYIKNKICLSENPNLSSLWWICLLSPEKGDFFLIILEMIT